jgi:hypothetical protein
MQPLQQFKPAQTKPAATQYAFQQLLMAPNLGMWWGAAKGPHLWRQGMQAMHQNMLHVVNKRVANTENVHCLQGLSHSHATYCQAPKQPTQIGSV